MKKPQVKPQGKPRLLPKAAPPNKLELAAKPQAKSGKKK